MKTKNYQLGLDRRPIPGSGELDMSYNGYMHEKDGHYGNKRYKQIGSDI